MELVRIDDCIINMDHVAQVRITYRLNDPIQPIISLRGTRDNEMALFLGELAERFLAYLERKGYYNA